MAKQLKILRGPGSIPLYVTEMTDEGWTGALAADTDTTVAVPAGSRVALIGASDHYFVSESVITLPVVGAGFAKTDAEQDKDQINVEEVTTLHFRSRNTNDISIAFYG